MCTQGYTWFYQKKWCLWVGFSWILKKMGKREMQFWDFHFWKCATQKTLFLLNRGWVRRANYYWFPVNLHRVLRKTHIQKVDFFPLPCLFPVPFRAKIHEKKKGKGSPACKKKRETNKTVFFDCFWPFLTKKWNLDFWKNEIYGFFAFFTFFFTFFSSSLIKGRKTGHFSCFFRKKVKKTCFLKNKKRGRVSSRKKDTGFTYNRFFVFEKTL
jgi:hypothetical protein